MYYYFCVSHAAVRSQYLMSIGWLKTSIILMMLSCDIQHRKNSYRTSVVSMFVHCTTKNVPQFHCGFKNITAEIQKAWTSLKLFHWFLVTLGIKLLCILHIKSLLLLQLLYEKKNKVKTKNILKKKQLNCLLICFGPQKSLPVIQVAKNIAVLVFMLMFMEEARR